MRTEHRTPLGRVVVARLLERGAVEVAGPIAAQDVGEVVETMRRLGAERVLVDGSIDRRAGASPRLADGVVMSTGAVLSADLDQLVRRTKAAVELLTLAAVEDAELHARGGAGTSALLLDDGEAVPLDAAASCTTASRDRAAAARRAPTCARSSCRGALCEPLLDQLGRARRGAPLTVVADDATRVFLGARHGARATARAASSSRCWRRSRCWRSRRTRSRRCAHRFDPHELRARIADELPGVPVLDVLAEQPAAVRRAGPRSAHAARRVRRRTPFGHRGGERSAATPPFAVPSAVS